MKIFMTGGTGFVGRNLTRVLVRAGHEVTVLTRSEKGGLPPEAGVSMISGNPVQKGDWQGKVGSFDGVINLAGASIFSRWTEEGKRRLQESRFLTTRNLVEAMGEGKGKTFFSTSAVGYYGFRGDEALGEKDSPGDDFLARLARDWEKEAVRAEEKGWRVVLNRFGIVLGEEGGALGQMVPLFRKYLGGPLGSGKQWFSWIHIEDLARAYLFLLEHPVISGPVNCTAPNPVRNRELAEAIGRVLHKPAFLRAPGFMMKLVLGEFGSVLLEGQRVLPQKLLQNGFAFHYPKIAEALAQILTAS